MIYDFHSCLLQVKCEKYWPDESEAYGEIKVTAIKSRAFADYITRTFIVEKVLMLRSLQKYSSFLQLYDCIYLVRSENNDLL